MTVDSAFIAYVSDQLQSWGGVSVRRLFGGHGLFRGDVMFGLVHRDTLFFRTDASNQGDFTAAGMPPFRYNRAGRDVALGYHEVPTEILDDPDQLAGWAGKALAVALARRSRHPQKSPKSGGETRRPKPGGEKRAWRTRSI